MEAVKTLEATSKSRSVSKSAYWAFLILGALALISLLYIRANIYYMYIVVYIWFGVAIGMLLQRGRFCIASASRDLFAAKVPRMAVVVLMTLVFLSIIQAILAVTKVSAPFFQPVPAGFYLLIAGLLFGLGMVFAGGCATGSTYKTGEGHGTSLLALLTLVFGQAIFVTLGGPLNKLLPQSWVQAATAKVPSGKLSSWYDTYLMGYVFDKPTIQLSKTGFIANTFPGSAKYFIGDAFLNVIVPAIILLVAIYVYAARKGFIKKRRKAKGSTGFGDELAGIWNMLVQSKKTIFIGFLIAVTIGLHILVAKGMLDKFGANNFGELLARMDHKEGLTAAGKIFDPGYWFMTTQQSQLGAWLLDKIGLINVKDSVFFGLLNGVPAPWDNPPLWMLIGIILGAMVAAMASREFKFHPPKGELIAWGLIGGLLLGIGSRLGLG